MATFKNKGFTLIELVIGMAVLAIAMMLMSTMLVSQNRNVVGPLHQSRASQFGQSILQNFLSFSYDEIENTSAAFNDVNDFVADDFEAIFKYQYIFGDNLSKQYNHYQVKVSVSENVETDSKFSMKRIDVTIKTPNDDEIVFSALKGDY